MSRAPIAAYANVQTVPLSSDSVHMEPAQSLRTQQRAVLFQFQGVKNEAIHGKKWKYTVETVNR
jgi:hypothetical protein